MREYSEQVALLRGENAEKRILGGRFGSMLSNFYAIVGRTVQLLTFITAYFQANVVIPYLIVAPYFFLGKITLGQMTQTAGAFGRVEAALTFFIARYQSLASYKAVVERLTTFRSAIDEARRLGTKPLRIERTEHLGRDLVLRDLVLCLPDGRAIVCVDRLIIAQRWRPGKAGGDGYWRSLGGTFSGALVAVEGPARDVALFGVGTDGRVRRCVLDSGEQAEWEDLGGAIAGGLIVLDGRARSGAARHRSRRTDRLSIGAAWRRGGDGLAAARWPQGGLARGTARRARRPFWWWL